MATQIVFNGKTLSFILPTTYNDNVTPLPLSAVTGIKISVGGVSGGPYPKSVEDTSLVPDATTGKCSYPIASLGVDLTKPNYAVLYTDIANAESIASAEVGFQNLAPNPPSEVSVS